MDKSLKNEIATVTGILALAYLKSRRYKAAALLGGLATGMYLTSSTRPFQWEGKSILITGGSRGLGLALARQLVSQGAKVTLVARKFEELARARTMLITEFPWAEVCTVMADVTRKDQLSNAITEAISAFGVLDGMINNAGAISVGPLESMTRADFEAQMKLHLYAVIEATEMIRSYFKQRGGGRIINICSLGGKSAVPHMLPYNASKFALAGFSQGSAIELAKDGIKVTTVYPALMRTGSPIQAVFKGDHEKEFAWFETADSIPGLSMEVDKAARKILIGAANGDSEVVLSPIGKLRVIGGALFPELIHSFMVMINTLMPKGQSGVRQTGYQSRKLFENSILTRPFRQVARKAEARNNQHPSHDAEFNLGLHS
ncbi:MAG: SDR family oxidoreductase [Bdellovibrionaceae bacterium]|nr:SDR family oxidoreductase [Pseudobdellovibrionaceae bacterium]